MLDLANTYQAAPHLFDEVAADLAKDSSCYERFFSNLTGTDLDTFKRLNDAAKISFLNQGITYALYTNEESVEQIFPFDLIPRILTGDEWAEIERGVIQRNIALNHFIHDVYNKQQIIKDNIVPEYLIRSSSHYCDMMENFSPPKDIYIHICGSDLIRHSDGNFYVLEDNVRSPSGVSYVLTNRVAMKRVLTHSFKETSVEAVDNYTNQLLQSLWNVSGRELGDIFCVLLTPGSYNSAYFEHTFLAQKMGIELVEGRDLFVKDDYVYLDTIGDKVRVDVIYRRIDDSYLDPEVFLADSQLGVPGLMGAYLKGNVAIVNAPGTGISDDKAVCSLVPKMIKYYLDEDPIIPNVPTYLCHLEDDLKYTLENLSKLVVKPVDMSGGYGVCICDEMTKAELEELAGKIKGNPRNFIAQPKMSLSTHATYIEDSSTFEPRHIDLRTFTILGGSEPFVLKGGLTRTALVKDSLIVNSSQGGGSKDTWVIKD